MTPDEAKKAAALAALQYVQPGQILGVGTGSTVNHFIDALSSLKGSIPGAVSSSEASTARLKAVGIAVLDANEAGPLSIYVDGADESDHEVTEHLCMTKGGGGALTREKIVAEASAKFICIADGSKLVPVLGKFPLPVEVIPMALALVARQLTAMGGQPKLREGFVTDNGNVILDVRNLTILDPPDLESRLNQITGVVTNGLFARRPADVLLLAGAQGVETLRRPAPAMKLS